MDYTIPYERKILRAFLIDTSIRTYFSHLEPDHFSYLPYRMIYTVWREYFTKYKSIPSIEIFVREFARHYPQDKLHMVEISQIAQAIRECYSFDGLPLHEIEYLRDDLERFISARLMKKAIAQAASFLHEGNVDQARVVLREGSKYEGLSHDLGSEYASTYLDRIAQRATMNTDLRIPTLLPSLDRVLNLGLAPKELGIVLAPSGRGKSMMLINFSFACMCMRKRVFYLTLDMSEFKTFSRFDALFSGIALNELREKSKELQDMIERVQSHKDLLFVKELPRKSLRVTDIGVFLEIARDRGMPFDLLIVDYGDCLRPSRSYRELRFELKDIFDNLAGIASEFNIPIWTATQAGRKAFTARVVTEQHIDESIAKIFPADIVISLSQTEEERRSKQMRLVPIKVRDNYREEDIIIETDFGHARIREVDPPKDEIDDITRFVQ